MNVSTQLHNAKAALWLQRIRDQKENGLKIKDWCAVNALTIHAFYYWKRTLKEEIARGETYPEIVPIPMTDISPDPEISSTPSVMYSSDSRDLSDSRNLHNLCNSRKSRIPDNTIFISANGIKMEISSSASDEMILRIIKAVRYV